MKKITLIIIILLGLGVFLSCEKELRDPKLDPSQSTAPAITGPSDGQAFVFTEEQAEEVFATFQWSDALYNISGLENTKYILQMDKAGNNFANMYELVNTTETTYAMKGGAMNKILLSLGNPADSVINYEFRLYCYVSSDSDITDLYSSVISLSFTCYEALVESKSIYLLGDATPVGWDNMAALEMVQIGEGVFARVETLDPAGEWFKFISVLGFWAPQWGTDETGTAELGPLVYRPDEATADPPAMPSPDVLGAYYIEADTVNLSYRTFLTSGELYLVGSATLAGWDNTAALPFTEVEPHVFEITTSLIDGGMKFLEIVGAWAPQWGTDDTATGLGGPLIYRPDEQTTDPAEVPSPGTGTFKIRVDLTTMSYTTEAQ
ncbi:MAG: SusE domain-containing protein [Bacteroidales bacterium]|nr:SusE domain-containing protein [Bacteroidales bacterium]MCF8404881.1 SusE domain-containing protein [Bacteroidales bacterium]